MTSGSRVTTQTPSRRAARRAAKTSLSIARASSQRSLGPSTGTRRCLALTRSLAGTAQMIIVTGAARPGTLRGWPEPGATRHRSATRVSFHTGAARPGTLRGWPEPGATRHRSATRVSFHTGAARPGTLRGWPEPGATRHRSATRVSFHTGAARPGTLRGWPEPGATRHRSATRVSFHTGAARPGTLRGWPEPGATRHRSATRVSFHTGAARPGTLRGWPEPGATRHRSATRVSFHTGAARPGTLRGWPEPGATRHRSATRVSFHTGAARPGTLRGWPEPGATRHRSATRVSFHTGAARPGTLRGWPEPGATRHRSATRVSFHRAPRTENDARQGDLPIAVGHDDVGQHGLDAQARQLGDAPRVAPIDDERSEPRRVCRRDPDGGDGQATGPHERTGRPAHRGAAHDRAHRDDAGARAGERVRDAGDGEDRTDGRHRVRWADDDHLGLADRLENARCRPGLGGARVLDVEDLDLGLLAHEVLLEREPAVRRPDPRAHGLVAHGEDARRHAQTTAQLGHHRRERQALAERARPVEMRGEVAVAQVEPRLGAEVAHRLEAAERLSRQAPAARRVQPARERVHHGVEVGGDVEAPDLGVVTGVADHGERIPGARGREAAQELRRARAARDRGQAHVTRAWLPAGSRGRCRRATRRVRRPPGGRGWRAACSPAPG